MSVRSGLRLGLKSSQSPSQTVTWSSSASSSSVRSPSQLSSSPLHTSAAEVFTAASVSSQSPAQVGSPSPSSSSSLGKMYPLHALSTPSHSSSAPGYTDG